MECTVATPIIIDGKCGKLRAISVEQPAITVVICSAHAQGLHKHTIDLCSHHGQHIDDSIGQG